MSTSKAPRALKGWVIRTGSCRTSRRQHSRQREDVRARTLERSTDCEQPGSAERYKGLSLTCTRGRCSRRHNTLKIENATLRELKIDHCALNLSHEMDSRTSAERMHARQTLPRVRLMCCIIVTEVVSWSSFISTSPSKDGSGRRLGPANATRSNKILTCLTNTIPRNVFRQIR